MQASTIGVQVRPSPDPNLDARNARPYWLRPTCPTCPPISGKSLLWGVGPRCAVQEGALFLS